MSSEDMVLVTHYQGDEESCVFYLRKDFPEGYENKDVVIVDTETRKEITNFYFFRYEGKVVFINAPRGLFDIHQRVGPEK